MKHGTRVGPTLAALASITLLAGCAAAPSEDSAGSPASSDFTPCLVSGTGGFDDKSFNQSAYEGMMTASASAGVEAVTVESADETAYAPNLEQMVDQDCSLVVSVGFPLADATKAAATTNPDIDFAIIDDASIDLPNVKPILFQTSEAAFLAGYAAAATSQSKVVGTFGGMQIPSVTIFMDGFAGGVAHYNEQKDADVEVVGWDVESQTGLFTGGFEAGVQAKTIAQGLIDQGADVILPVGGPIFQSAAAAIRDTGLQIALIGVDADNYLTAPDLKDLFLTSIMKGIATGTEDVVVTAADGEFDNSPYVGTLANQGVGIAPFHDYEDAVPSTLQSELDQLTQEIIDGTITVDSPSNLQQ